MPARSAKWYAATMLATLRDDLDERLEEIDQYVHGDQRLPFTPDNADAEYRTLAKRAITNVVDMRVKAVCQNMAIDGFRPGRQKRSDGAGDTRLSHTHSPQWDFFQRNNLDSRQDAVHLAAGRYGHAFVVNEKDKDGGKSRARGLSPLTTTALFDDPANDIAPRAALNVTSWPDGDYDGEAVMWLGPHRYKVAFDSGDVVRVGRKERHGWDEPPVTRFAIEVDLDGRTMGLIEPLINIQDRLNQAVFDLLVNSTYNAFQVRTITGMAPPVLTEPVYETDPDTDERVIVGAKPVLDKDTGQPRPRPINMLAKSVQWAEDPDVQFGVLPGNPLEGHIAQVRAVFQEYTALAQVPPHYMLGEIANLSAEALDAAQQSLERLTASVRVQLGESWERVVRLAMEIENEEGADDIHAEAIWADKDGRAFAAFADGAGKLRSELGIPGRGLWHRVPGATQGELTLWEDLADEEPEVALASAVTRASGTVRQPPRTATEVA